MLTTAYRFNGPAAVRYPRGSGNGTMPDTALDAIEIGKGEIRREGRDIAILAFGSMLAPALEAAEGLGATVANMRFVKPLDRELLANLASRHDLLVTIEENSIIGGAGAEVARALEEAGLNTQLLRLGLPDSFIDHGDSVALLQELGLDATGIAASIRATRTTK
jgi:1-deoxy-D-xylulose-5-phosphate synthase